MDLPAALSRTSFIGGGRASFEWHKIGTSHRPFGRITGLIVVVVVVIIIIIIA